MKKAHYWIFPVFFLLVACDYWATYTFEVENSTSKNIKLVFSNPSNSFSNNENGEVIILLPKDKKTIRIIECVEEWNTYAHDCLHEHGIAFLKELVFDTYLDNVKIEKQLWQEHNWTYKKLSKMTATYSLTITEELCQQE